MTPAFGHGRSVWCASPGSSVDIMRQELEHQRCLTRAFTPKHLKSKCARRSQRPLTLPGVTKRRQHDAKLRSARYGRVADQHRGHRVLCIAVACQALHLVFAPKRQACRTALLRPYTLCTFVDIHGRPKPVSTALIRVHRMHVWLNLAPTTSHALSKNPERREAIWE
jgi:hypothetical protein